MARDSGKPLPALSAAVEESIIKAGEPDRRRFHRPCGDNLPCQWRKYFEFLKSGTLHRCFRRVGDCSRRQDIRQVKACHANPVVSHPVIDVETVW